MAMLKFSLSITMVAIMAKMAILSILAMALGVINMYLVKEHKKLDQLC